MKLFKKTLATLATIGVMTAAGSANAITTNWYIDQDGSAGVGGTTLITSFLDITGGALVALSPTGGTGFDFTEWGAVRSTTHDFGLDYNATQTANLASLFTASGTGTFGGSASFQIGTLNLYSIGLGTWGTTSGTFGVTGSPIATFQIIGGGLTVNPDGTPTANGQVEIIARATFMSAGYFFQDAAQTLDLASIVSSPDGLIFGFATTNANFIPTNQLNLTFASEIRDYSGLPGPVVNDPTLGQFYVSNNGQYRLQIPEPASLALFGVGLLGLGMMRRRREDA
jgi:hypothetical protein